MSAIKPKCHLTFKPHRRLYTCHDTLLRRQTATQWTCSCNIPNAIKKKKKRREKRREASQVITYPSSRL